MTPPKRCTRCGASLPQGLHICLDCGLIISSVEDIVLEKKDSPTEVIKPRQKTKTGPKLRQPVAIGLIVMAVVVLFFVFAGRYLRPVTGVVQPSETAGETISNMGLIPTQDDSLGVPTVAAQELEPAISPTQERTAVKPTDSPTEAPAATQIATTQSPTPDVEPSPPIPESYYSNYNLAFTSGKGNSFQVYLMDAENPEDWAVLPLPDGYERAYWPTFCNQSLAFDVEDQNFIMPRWVYLYDLVQDRLQSLDLHDETIERAIFPSCSPRDAYLGVTVFRGGDWFIDIFDFEQNRIIFELESGEYPLISNISWSFMLPEFYWMGTRSTGFTEINLTQNFDGNAETALYAQGRYPALSPDGKFLVSFCGNLFHLCVFDLQSGEKVFQQTIHYAKQINGKQATASAAWSPDGQWIYFVSSLSGNWDIYRMHPDGSGLVNLTAGWGSDELMPATR